MSLEELQLGPDPDDPRIELHPQLTVVSGIGEADRAELVQTLRDAARGAHPRAALRYRDRLGRAVVLRAGTDGGPEVEALEPEGGGSHLLPAIGEADLPRVMVVDAPVLGLVPTTPEPLEHPDLDHARAVLASVDAEVAVAEREAAARAELAQQLAAVEGELVAIERALPRRAYARARLALEAVRTEAAAAIATLEEMDADARLVAAGPHLEHAALGWHEATAEAVALDKALAGAAPLTAAERAEAMHAPDEVDPGVLELHAEVGRLVDRVAALRAEIAALTQQGPQAPADPIVALLAHQDQELLWATHATVLAASEALDQAQLAVGGVGAGAGAARLVQALDDAHEGVAASRLRAKRQLMGGATVAAIAAVGAISTFSAMPFVAGVALLAALACIGMVLVLPQRSVRVAEEAEADALAKVSARSYHGFQLRRIEANDPAMRKRLARATADHKGAQAAWAEVAGAVSLVDAATREQEVRAFSVELSRSQAAVQALASARRTLADHVEPALADRRRTLAGLCGAPEGTDPDEAVERLRQRVARGRQARLELRRDHARGRADEAAHDLAGVLDAMGAPAGELATRVSAAWRAHDGARQRQAARAAARPAAEVAADLAEREAAEGAARCPGWEQVGPEEAVEPDVVPLRATRDRLAAELATARAAAADVDDLARRRAAALGTLDAVVARLTPPTPEVEADPDRIASRLLDRLADAGHPHPGRTLGILDEAFTHVPVRSTWDLLDMVERVGSRCSSCT